MNDNCQAGICEAGWVDLNACSPSPVACYRTWCDTGFGGYCHREWRTCDDSDACTTDQCVEPYGHCQNTLSCVGGWTGCGVRDVRIADDKQTLSWILPALNCPGPPTVGHGYDVLAGRLDQLPVGSNPASERCVAYHQSPLSVRDTVNPAVGTGTWYLVRMFTQGPGNVLPTLYTWGSQGQQGAPGATRQTTTCQSP